MANTSRLPGMYIDETYSPRLNTSVGGNASVAFVGPAVGYRTASQQFVLDDATGVTLNNKGVIADSYTVTGTSGLEYENNADYVAVQDTDGATTISRNLRSTDTAKTSVTSKQFTFYLAEPGFNLLVDDEGEPIDGYLIAGTVIVKDDQDKTYVEGVDYSIDYYSGMFEYTVGGELENDTRLSISYDWTTAEPIELPGEASFTLAHKFISKGISGENTLVIVSSQTNGNNYGDTPDGSGGGQVEGGYIEGIDFFVDYRTGRINRTASSRIPSFEEGEGNLMYAAYTYSGIRSGDTVTVTYNYRGEGYTSPLHFNEYNDCLSVYGSPWDVAGNIQSPLSLMAYLANNNGMGDFYACACQPASYGTEAPTYPVSSYEDALEELTKISGIDLIVVASGDREVWSAVETHIRVMASEQDERRAILGFDGTEAAITNDQMAAYAQSVGSQDINVVAPDVFLFTNRVTGVPEDIPGFYAAAAIAGYMNSIPQNQPIMNKNIVGFNTKEEASRLNTATVKRTLRDAGCMYLDNVNGAYRIVDDVTTSRDSVIKRETNIQMVKQYLIKGLRSGFAQGFIGIPSTVTTRLDIKSSLNSYLQGLMNIDFLEDYSDPLVEPDETDPTQINITFDYKPVYSIKYLQINFSVNSTSATVSST